MRTVEFTLVGLENQLTEMCNQREALQQSMWTSSGVRAGIKASYGDDSPQFEMVGGTRLSDRKPPRRSQLSAEQP